MKLILYLLLPIFFLAGCAAPSTQFNTIDLDHDGVLSRGEFTDAVADAAFTAGDRNHDGFIDAGEWRVIEPGAGGDALFRARDMSRNGKISRQEARLAAEKNRSLLILFAATDRNRDGAIDPGEARNAGKTLQRRGNTLLP